jgi:hypothetical protein
VIAPDSLRVVVFIPPYPKGAWVRCRVSMTCDTYRDTRDTNHRATVGVSPGPYGAV